MAREFYRKDGNSKIYELIARPNKTGAAPMVILRPIGGSKADDIDVSEKEFAKRWRRTNP